MMLLAVVERLPSIADAIRQYGYPVLGAGLLLENAGIPVPGETMLLTAAGLAAVGQLDLAIVGTGALVVVVLVTKHLLRRRIGESDRPARPRP